MNVSRLNMIQRYLHTDAEDDEDERGGGGSHGNTRLPYGLCMAFGIKLPKGATPKQAWDALQGKGVDADEAYAALEKDGTIDKYVEEKEGKQVEEKKNKPKEPKMAKGVKDIYDKCKAIAESINKNPFTAVPQELDRQSISLAMSSVNQQLGYTTNTKERERLLANKKILTDLWDDANFIQSYNVNILKPYKKLQETVPEHLWGFHSKMVDYGELMASATSPKFQQRLDDFNARHPDSKIDIYGGLAKISDEHDKMAAQYAGAEGFSAFDLNKLQIDEAKQAKGLDDLSENTYCQKHMDYENEIADGIMKYAEAMNKVVDGIAAVMENKTLTAEERNEGLKEIREKLKEKCDDIKNGGKLLNSTELYKAQLWSGLRQLSSSPSLSYLYKSALKSRLTNADKAAGKYDNPKANKSNCIRGQHVKFDNSAFTKERKDNAIWCKSKAESVEKFKGMADKLFSNATNNELRAVGDYAKTSYWATAALSGYDDKDMMAISYKGIGNNDAIYDDKKLRKSIDTLTKLIAKSSLENDTWLKRGVTDRGFERTLGVEKLSMDEIQNMIKEGKVLHMPGFCSCGASKDTGFNRNVILNIYCPKGTKAAYIAPNAYATHHNYRGGDFTAADIHDENEMLLQRDTYFKITKCKKDTNGKWFIDLEVVEQAPLDYNKLR
ncbi:MAG: ADP-ribosyltransferase [Clostridia bacterium]|nr:ADP-ribosyltransferase [Clostridia bacterium]